MSKPAVEGLADYWLGLYMEKIVETTKSPSVIRCARCLTPVTLDEVSDGYFAVCPSHDEDLYQFETVTTKEN